MRMTRREHLLMLGTAAAALPVLGTAGAARASGEAAAGAKVVEVQMLNEHPENPREKMVFYPDIVQVNPGDTIRFLSTMRGHNVELDDNMMPEGAETWKSRINEDFEITLDVEGTYGFYCTPHRSAGMVGLILVGDASVNFAEAQEARQRGRAKKRYEDIFARAAEMVETGAS